MQPRLEACLILGCHGYINDSFTNCSCVKNVILDLAIFEEQEYINVVKFLDQACELLDKTINDYNKCTNAVSMLYRDHNAFDQKMLHNIQRFLRTHRECGIWLSLILKKDI